MSYLLLFCLALQSAASTAEVIDATAEGEGLAAAQQLVMANAAYEAGNFAESIQSYEALIERGYDGGLLHYNLGDALLRNGELGRAIASFRRARKRAPRNREIRANLEFARKSARDDIAPPEPSAVPRTIFFWHYGLSRSELWQVMIISNLLFWLLVSARALYRRRSELLRWAVIVCLAPLVASAGSLLVHAVALQRIAVILPPELNVYSGTGVDTEVRFKLHAGCEIRLVEELGDWIRIALPDGQQGWIEARHSEISAL